MSRPLVLALFCSGCVGEAFTPPTRPMPLGTAEIPRSGEWDLQGDGNLSGAVMGPGIYGGNMRYRRGISDRVALSGDAGFLAMQNAESRSGEAWAGLTRLGAQVRASATADIDAAAFAGLGGGYAPLAGAWTGGDVGGVLSGTNKYLRPMLLLDVYAAQPFATKRFEAGGEMLRLPRTFGLQGMAGLDVGPRDRSVLVGLAVATLYASATDVQDSLADTFFGLGAGFRFAD